MILNLLTLLPSLAFKKYIPAALSEIFITFEPENIFSDESNYPILL